MPVDQAEWSEDYCTCGHAQSDHVDGTNRCRSCDENADWARSGPAYAFRSDRCFRYQWNEKPRKRVW